MFNQFHKERVKSKMRSRHKLATQSDIVAFLNAHALNFPQIPEKEIL